MRGARVRAHDERDACDPADRHPLTLPCLAFLCCWIDIDFRFQNLDPDRTEGCPMKPRLSLLAPRAVHVYLFSVLVLAACGDDGAVAVDYAPTLQSLTQCAAVPHVDQFGTDAAALSASLASLDSAMTAETLASAQAAWRAARVSWRKLDALHFGPVADDALSDRIDLQPADVADMEAIIAGTEPIDVTSIGKLGGKDKGFLGLEYLLFSTDGSATALARLQGDGPAARRRMLAIAIASEIGATGQALQTSWTGGTTPFATQVMTAGTAGSRYLRQRGALDDYVGAVHYAIEWVVGIRLAAPLGRTTTGTPDPTLDFTRASDSAVSDMVASIAGARAVYDCGMSAYLADHAAPVGVRTAADFDTCAAKIAAIPGRFDTAVVSNTAAVQAAYDACKALKATWAAEVTSALGSSIRFSDNDGD
jgi:predicted lipoprotein